MKTHAASQNTSRAASDHAPVAAPGHAIQVAPAPARAPRRDGLSTRTAILEAAGQIFAERGFAEATSKEICERAGANSAAVNYYFGGKGQLYEAVLTAAHLQLVSLEDLSGIVDSGASPEEKLRAFLAHMLHVAMTASELWGVRVFLRELAAPSAHIGNIVQPTILPKAAKLRALVQGVTGLPPDSVHVQRAVALVVLPCLGLILFPEAVRTVILPATAAHSEGLLDDMFTYALAGLRALSASTIPNTPDTPEHS